MKKELIIYSSDGVTKLHTVVWEPENTIEGVLIIAHGMAEYIERYEELALYLNKRGIAVMGNDMIGHGKSSAPEDYGYFGKKNGWKHIISDVELVRKEAEAMYPGIPQYLLGHSMGSFVARCYLAMYGNVEKAIIMGTSGKNPATRVGASLVATLRGLRGERYKSRFITNMAFGSYTKKIENPISKNAWLSRNLDNIRKYDADPACGFMFTLAAYSDLFNMLNYMSSDECYEKTAKNVPLLIISGADDPVGNYGNGPKEVASRHASIRNNTDAAVVLKLYDGLLHEILKEDKKEEVMAFCHSFLCD